MTVKNLTFGDGQEPLLVNVEFGKGRIAMFIFGEQGRVEQVCGVNCATAKLSKVLRVCKNVFGCWTPAEAF